MASNESIIFHPSNSRTRLCPTNFKSIQNFPVKADDFSEFFWSMQITKDGKKHKFDGAKVNIKMQCTISAAQLKSCLIPCLQKHNTHMDSSYIWSRLPCLVWWIYCRHNEFVHRITANEIIFDKMKEMYAASKKNGNDALSAKLTDQQKSEIEHLEHKGGIPTTTILVKSGSIRYKHNGTVITMEGLRIGALNPWQYVLHEIIAKLDPHLLGSDKTIIPLNTKKKLEARPTSHYYQQ